MSVNLLNSFAFSGNKRPRNHTYRHHSRATQYIRSVFSDSDYDEIEILMPKRAHIPSTTQKTTPKKNEMNAHCCRNKSNNSCRFNKARKTI